MYDGETAIHTPKHYALNGEHPLGLGRSSF